MVKPAWADQGYTGEQAKSDASGHGIELQVVKLADAKKGFVLLPRHWVVERLPEVLAGLHFVVLAMLMLPKAALLLAVQMDSQHALRELTLIKVINVCHQREAHCQ